MVLSVCVRARVCVTVGGWVVEKGWGPVAEAALCWRAASMPHAYCLHPPTPAAPGPHACCFRPTLARPLSQTHWVARDEAMMSAAPSQPSKPHLQCGGGAAAQPLWLKTEPAWAVTDLQKKEASSHGGRLRSTQRSHGSATGRSWRTQRGKMLSWYAHSLALTFRSHASILTLLPTHSKIRLLGKSGAQHRPPEIPAR